MESLYEKELKGKDGCEISIVDENEETKEIVASALKEDGKEVRLTIDASLVENVKDLGGSAYVVQKAREVLGRYLI